MIAVLFLGLTTGQGTWLSSGGGGHSEGAGRADIYETTSLHSLTLHATLCWRASTTSDFSNQETEAHNDLPSVTTASATFNSQAPDPWPTQCPPLSAQDLR